MTQFSDLGWLYSSPEASCRWRPSPHYNQRPEGMQTSLVVVHGISLPAGHFGGPWIDALFMNQLSQESPHGLGSLAGLEVSSHFLIARDGSHTQYVSILNRAWHAGVSVFEDQPNCNDYSVGIELEGTDDLPYTEAQMQALTLLCRALAQALPTLRAITGHSVVAPGRKTDPGPAFDWLDLRQRLVALGLPWKVVDAG
ncbi:MAG: 1,6-anhydro-N-acetylmuramyl-L-alanine amidase AmpD [Burkholderiaceae bacterium]|jgi:AmpD protein